MQKKDGCMSQSQRHNHDFESRIGLVGSTRHITLGKRVMNLVQYIRPNKRLNLREHVGLLGLSRSFQNRIYVDIL